MCTVVVMTSIDDKCINVNVVVFLKRYGKERTSVFCCCTVCMKICDNPCAALASRAPEFH